MAIDILFAIYWYGMGTFHKILVPMKAGRPFEEGVSKLFKRLAWVVLIGGCFNEILLLIAEAVAKETARSCKENPTKHYRCVI